MIWTNENQYQYQHRNRERKKRRFYGIPKRFITLPEEKEISPEEEFPGTIIDETIHVIANSNVCLCGFRYDFSNSLKPKNITMVMHKNITCPKCRSLAKVMNES